MPYRDSINIKSANLIKMQGEGEYDRNMLLKIKKCIRLCINYIDILYNKDKGFMLKNKGLLEDYIVEGDCINNQLFVLIRKKVNSIYSNLRSSYSKKIGDILSQV